MIPEVLSNGNGGFNALVVGPVFIIGYLAVVWAVGAGYHKEAFATLSGIAVAAFGFGYVYLTDEQFGQMVAGARDVIYYMSPAVALVLVYAGIQYWQARGSRANE